MIRPSWSGDESTSPHCSFIRCPKRQYGKTLDICLIFAGYDGQERVCSQFDHYGTSAAISTSRSQTGDVMESTTNLSSAQIEGMAEQSLQLQCPESKTRSLTRESGSIYSTVIALVSFLCAVFFLVFSADEVQARGSSHDFKRSNGNVNSDMSQTDQMCVICHTPRSATPIVQQWSKSADSSGVLMYSNQSSDMQAFKSPSDTSALCLSCHDGSLAFDQLDSGPSKAMSTGFRSLIDGSATNLGKDLSDDHPISISYDSFKPNRFHRAVGGKVGPLPLFGENKDQVECSTCHDPHAGNEAYLRISNSRSALCLTCHIK